MRDRERAIAEVRPYIARARTFSGWNFDDLAVRNLPPGPPRWDYAAIARKHAKTAESMIDFGTGGGEVYSRIVSGLECRKVASEEWVVNAPVAHRRLVPLGVDVVHADSLRAPFRAASFDVALSRHEAIEPAEIDRVLRPGGIFITQQVARLHWQELSPFFPNRAVFIDHFAVYGNWFRGAGYEVETREHQWPLAYADIGEIAFMLMIAPWELPDFDPVREIDALLALEDACRTDDGIVLTADRYLMVARKPS
jgi:SAM-dependent methyltransferase